MSSPFSHFHEWNVIEYMFKICIIQCKNCFMIINPKCLYATWESVFLSKISLPIIKKTEELKPTWPPKFYTVLGVRVTVVVVRDWQQWTMSLSASALAHLHTDRRTHSTNCCNIKSLIFTDLFSVLSGCSGNTKLQILLYVSGLLFN